MDNRHKHLEPQSIELEGTIVESISVGGVGTSFSLPQYKMTFDVAQGLPFSTFSNIFCITHPHMDHASGIPYIISARSLAGIDDNKFIVPRYMVEPLNEIMKAWEKMEGHKYKYEFIGMSPGETYDLGKGRKIRPFKTYHRVESQGYTLLEVKKKLKSEYLNLTQDEIKAKVASGAVLSEELETPLFSFTGDTTAELFESPPIELAKSKILVTECTYFGDSKYLERANKWGHLHLKQLLECLENIHSQKIVLMHLSSRFQARELEEELDNLNLGAYRERFVVFPKN